MSEWANRTLKDADVRVIKGEGLTSDKMVSGEIPVIAGGLSYCGMHNRANRNENCITVSASGANAGAVLFHKSKIFATDCSSIEWGGSQEFLFYALARRQKEFTSMQSGLAQPHVYPRDIEKIVLFYPTDTKEQSRIAAVLTATDEAVAASRALVEKYTAVKQGLMRDLLTGNGSLNRFSEIADPISRKGSANGRICINMDCVESGTGELLPIVDAENSSAKTEFVAGDVLFGKLRPYLRKYWLATFDGVCSSELMVFRAKPNIRRQYLYYIVSSNAFIEYNNSQTYGTKMPRTSWSIIKQYKTNVPNISEQDRVIEVLSAADERLATERKRLMKLEYIKRGLMDDLLTNRVSTDKLQGGI